MRVTIIVVLIIVIFSMLISIANSSVTITPAAIDFIVSSCLDHKGVSQVELSKQRGIQVQCVDGEIFSSNKSDA